MKNIYLCILLFLCAIALVFTACKLNKEPEIPTGVGNEELPVFLSTDVAPITHDSIRAKARLSSRGNLNILHYGWAWSSFPDTFLVDTLEFNDLGIDSFETLIPNLDIGRFYIVRPYVVTGSGKTYGPAGFVFMGIPKLDPIHVVANDACLLRVRVRVETPDTLVEYGIVYLAGTGTPTLQKKDGQLGLSFGLFLDSVTFQMDLTTLNPNTVYSVRAYATTAFGTGYSKTMLYTPPSSSPLTVNFSINTDAELFQGAIVQFTNTSMGAANYTWSIDGMTSSETSPVYTFNTLGNKLVRLQAGNGNCILTKDTVLTVIPDPFKNYFVAIPGGTFMMGCTSEQSPCYPQELPVHNVTLSPYFIGKTEVTQRQWLAVTDFNPSLFSQCGLDCPVENISWDRIVNEFIPRLNRKTGRTYYHLPTSAEWEYAARGGMSTKYSGSNNLDSVAWYSLINAGNMTHPVAQKTPNGYGLYDMTGNLWELCNDWFDPAYYSFSPSINPPGPDIGSGRVVRGGAWFVLNPDYLRLAYHYGFYPFDQNNTVGFRLAHD